MRRSGACICVGAFMTVVLAGGCGGKESEDEVGRLVAQLSDESARVRATAARKLGRTGDARAFQLLVKAFQSDEDSRVRAAAARALGSWARWS